MKVAITNNGQTIDVMSSADASPTDIKKDSATAMVYTQYAESSSQANRQFRKELLVVGVVIAILVIANVSYLRHSIIK